MTVHDPKPDDLLLLRRLCRQERSDDRADLDRRLANEPALRHRFATLQRAWEALEAPPAVTLPADFSSRLRTLARHEVEGWRWSAAPAWARAGMAAALALGLGLGLGAQHLVPASPLQASPPGLDAAAGMADAEVWPSLIDASLADDYWQALDRLDQDPSAGSPLGDPP